MKFYYQWAQPSTSQATISIFLDDDLNLLNSNDRLLTQFAVQGNGAANVSSATVSFNLTAANAPAGLHALYARISGGGHTRYLYAPELLQVTPSLQPPTLDISAAGAGAYLVGINGVAGQTITLQTSTNLLDWQAQATNTLTANRWVYLDNQPVQSVSRYYRAFLQ